MSISVCYHQSSLETHHIHSFKQSHTHTIPYRYKIPKKFYCVPHHTYIYMHIHIHVYIMYRYNMTYLLFLLLYFLISLSFYFLTLRFDYKIISFNFLLISNKVWCNIYTHRIFLKPCPINN
jgi:hypothetical protein